MSATVATVLPRVHAVTNDEILADPGFLPRATTIMRALGTRGAVHLRGHRSRGALLHTLATTLMDLHRETGCWLIINDRVDVALSVGARAIQLTSTSLPLVDVRALVPDARIGASVHADAEAESAADEGAEWVVAGNVFGTGTHLGRAGRGSGFLRGIAAAGLPVVAIGGVRPDDVHDLRNAGAYGVAVIRGIWGADDAEEAATRYLSIYDPLGRA